MLVSQHKKTQETQWWTWTLASRRPTNECCVSTWSTVLGRWRQRHWSDSQCTGSTAEYDSAATDEPTFVRCGQEWKTAALDLVLQEATATFSHASLGHVERAVTVTRDEPGHGTIWLDAVQTTNSLNLWVRVLRRVSTFVRCGLFLVGRLKSVLFDAVYGKEHLKKEEAETTSCQFATASCVSRLQYPRLVTKKLCRRAADPGANLSVFGENDGWPKRNISGREQGIRWSNRNTW